MSKDTKKILEEFAIANGVDLTSLESLTNGVKTRIEAFGIERFNNLYYVDKIVVIEKAVEHYFDCAEQYHKDLLTNKDGAFDKLLTDVRALLDQKNKH